jgi:hypothetical protein
MHACAFTTSSLLCIAAATTFGSDCCGCCITLWPGGAFPLPLLFPGVLASLEVCMHVLSDANHPSLQLLRRLWLSSPLQAGRVSKDRRVRSIKARLGGKQEQQQQ